MKGVPGVIVLLSQVSPCSGSGILTPCTGAQQALTPRPLQHNPARPSGWAPPRQAPLPGEARQTGCTLRRAAAQGHVQVAGSPAQQESPCPSERACWTATRAGVHSFTEQTDLMDPGAVRCSGNTVGHQKQQAANRNTGRG